MHAAGGGEECERWKNHLVARTNIKRLQRKQNGVRTVGAADRMLGVAIGGHFLLKLVDLGAADEILTLHHGEHGRLDLRTDSGVLSFEVKKRDSDFTGGRGGHSEMIRSGALLVSARCCQIRPRRAMFHQVPQPLGPSPAPLAPPPSAQFASRVPP